MKRPAITPRRVRGLRYLLDRLGGSGRPAKAVFGRLPADRRDDLLSALRYAEELCAWHEAQGDSSS